MGCTTEIAYCGLYCGDCVIRKHHMGGLAGRLLEAIATPAFAKLAAGLPELNPDIFEPLKNHEGCRQVLAAIVHLDCAMPCRSGGGTSGCRIRECCRQKGMNGCWECGEFESCQTLAWLDPVNQGANVANLASSGTRGSRSSLPGRSFGRRSAESTCHGPQGWRFIDVYVNALQRPKRRGVTNWRPASP